jgi:hypothetical protein
MLLEKVTEVGAVRRWLYLAAKALRVGPARHCLGLSLQWVVTPFLGDVKPPCLDTWWRVDCPGTCGPGTESPRGGCRQSGRVLRQVMRLGRN